MQNEPAAHMKNLSPNGAATTTFTMDAYASALVRNGTEVISGTPGTFWAEYESHAMMRIPTFSLTVPSPEEVERVLWRGRAAVASYILEPGEHRDPNAWWYVCADPTYSLEKLNSAMRRNVRRGLKEFTIGHLTAEQILAHGMQAFCDTRRRAGLSDGPKEFDRRFSARAGCPAHVFLGAWKDDALAAFLSITEVDRWAEIEGSFSKDALLNSRPNDVLMYTILSRYLIDERRHLVSYGLSSIQQASDAQGLHAFKTKVGFEAKAVHRIFVLHPLLRPFANQLALHGINAVRKLFPKNRSVRKAYGVLACLLEKEQFSEVALMGRP